MNPMERLTAMDMMRSQNPSDREDDPIREVMNACDIPKLVSMDINIDTLIEDGLSPVEMQVVLNG